MSQTCTAVDCPIFYSIWLKLNVFVLDFPPYTLEISVQCS